jgi:phosphonate transport system substrate-binding protein
MNRRQALALLMFGAIAPAVQADEPLRIGLTPVFLDDQVGFLHVWRDYLSRKLERPVQFVQRNNYHEIVDLLIDAKIDFAWICGYPYVRHQARLRLLAVPLYLGRPRYQSYVIVPTRDTATGSLADLRGKVFAYSDPDSNSGFLYVQHELIRMQARPAGFFAKTFFTWAHRKVVEAVASGLAQGGAVDGYVWETLRIHHPDLTSRTRVVQKSPEFGFPPIAARAGAPAEDFARAQRVLLAMRDDPEGAQILSRLNLDGFVAAQPELFDGIARMVRAVGTQGHAAHP